MCGNMKSIFLLKRSPNNEEFLLESYSFTIDGLINIAMDEVCELFGEKREKLGYDISNGQLKIIATEDSYTFYIVAIDECAT